MYTDSYIPLNRQFLPVPKSQKEAEENEILSVWGHTNHKTWDELDKEFRSVILAEAGAGKTEEFRQHALELERSGKAAFFIRIEDIETDFYKSFEIGDEGKFWKWIQSTQEAWFFLDSVDESRLENPRAFAKAIRRFAKCIEKASHRAHIYLSSRPYAWRPKEDRSLMDEVLFRPIKQQGEAVEEYQRNKPKSALTIYTMRHLDKERIRRFCVTRSTKDVDRLISEIDRTNLWSLAERPFDLEGILAIWERRGELGGRLDLLHHNIEKRLRDEHNVDRHQHQPLNLKKAIQGVRRLSAAVVLTGQPGINVPDAASEKPGLEAETVLGDWAPQDVRALLERGIFNDVLYGAVRFRHRDVRDLLAAEWFEELLKSGNSRHSIESLFFREQYGERIITPLLRPLLPWLILFDEGVRRRALEIRPEIAVEGGDPSSLPLKERKKILSDIVRRIVSNTDDRSAQQNSAITRIANTDLAEETRHLIREYGHNDDAVFFLGRLVWQGEMGSCVEPLIDIGLDSRRGIYARKASARAVMSCGTTEQKRVMWEGLNEGDTLIPRHLLAEVAKEAAPNNHSIEQLLVSLEKVMPYKRFEITGLEQALHGFVERLTIVDDHLIIDQLIKGLHAYLERPPFVDRHQCRISVDYAWLLNPAAQLVERLIEAKNPVAFDGSALSIMMMVPSLRYWHDGNLTDYKGNLMEIVPQWPELNDALYWADVDQTRAAEEKKSGEPLTNDYLVSWPGHFWDFNATDLPRLLEYVRSRPLQDDRLVALSTAFRVYVQEDKPTQVLSDLREAVAGVPALEQQLENYLNPPHSETNRKHQERMEEIRRKREIEEARKQQNRSIWIEELKENPDRVYNRSNPAPGNFTNDQLWLMSELGGQGLTKDYSVFANWKALIPEFGQEVSQAYRVAALNHWRHYVPDLRSEGGQNKNIPYALIFGIAGLEIEAKEESGFPRNLDKTEVQRALRYITWELNGFPGWLEQVYQAFPDMVIKAVVKELLWELENTGSEEPMHYILYDIAYHAPWLHETITPLILEWAETNPKRIKANRHCCVNILTKGKTDPTRLAEFVNMQIAQMNNPDDTAWWYAILVDCDPVNGIPEVKRWLSGLDKDVAIHGAQIFITTLMGGGNIREGGPYYGCFREAEFLKSLYVLMLQYIRMEEDINRAGMGVYSPGLRDDAQSARDRLFNLIAETPGKASYTIINQLIQEHSDPDLRFWMAKQAYKRAEEDGDLEPWSAEQVSAFHKSQTIRPETNRQLFDLTINRLLDLKNWLERGDDSPYETWQRADNEPEVRTLIAGWLNQQRRDQYTTAEEPEIANSQRMDIRLNNPSVISPVPIELKLLENWSGPKLCERLRNQLAGDYLREEHARCGVMLLVYQGIVQRKRWRINGSLVELESLAGALKSYWKSIAGEFPGVDAIDVITIDLTHRQEVSDS